MSSNATGNAETLVSTLVAESIFDASITLLPSGGWIAVWTADSEDGGNAFSHTLFQRFDAGGNPVGAETQVGDPDAFYFDSAVVPLADGGWLIIHDRGNIFQQRFDADGNAVGGETQINTVSGDLRHASATVIEDGGWVVGWSRGSGGENVFQQVFDAEGNAVGGEVHVNTTTSGRHFFSDIEALPDGGWVVVWFKSSGEVLQQRYDANGDPVGSETQVNIVGGGNSNFPKATALADGGWVVTWADADGDQNGIFQQRYDSDGVAVGSQTAVNTTTASFQSSPDVTALPDSGWVVVWHSGGGQDGDGSGVYMQRFDVNGDPVGTETLVNVTTLSDQDNASVTAMDGGGWVVTWVSQDPDTGDEVVMQRVFAADIEGTSGNNSLEGTVFDETINGLGGNDTLVGADGVNNVLFGGASADRLDGGAGIDTADYSGSSSNVTVRLWNGTGQGGDAQGDILTGIENITGSAFNDALVGASGVDNLLRGGGGNDFLAGLSGNDTLIGGTGADTLDGGAGSDTADYTGSSVGVTVKLWNGTGVGGDAQGDILTGIENVTGSAFNDTLIGSNDVGNQLRGGAGHDYINGLSGNDLLFGGLGSDRLVGGAGNDTFHYESIAESPVAASDVIEDFGDGDDLISLTLIDANSTQNGNQVFSFIGTSGFSGNAGELRFENVGSDTVVFADIDGDGLSDFRIELTGNHLLTSDDFAL